jgi:3-phosphoshikimate 1-carboxyvinyltransferase
VVPGDKSISHRAALLGAIAEGPTEVFGFLESEDCLHTLGAIEKLGAEVTRKGSGHYRIAGVGLDGLHEPDTVLECGNSGTTARLLMGILAGQPFWTMLTGDDSLRRRPMGRVATPLRQMDATIVGRAGGTKLPLAVRGARPLRSLVYRTPIASAQVKSAVLLAGLWAEGPVSVEEPSASRDHSERLLRHFGAQLAVEGRTATLVPGTALRGQLVHVPGDISSAAFFLVGAAVVPGSRVTIRDVSLNPTRAGMLDALQAMGAALVRDDAADPPRESSADAALASGHPRRDDARRDSRTSGSDGWEPIGAVTAEAGPLVGTTIAGELIPRLIDEVPVLAVAAALATGQTEIRDAAELRVKESDRLAAVARQLGTMGARIDETPDGLVIHGGARLRGATVESGGDHRIAMALVIAGLAAQGETIVEDTGCIATSFPDFVATVNSITQDNTVSVTP